MRHEEQAKELIDKMFNCSHGIKTKQAARQCALVAVNFVIDRLHDETSSLYCDDSEMEELKLIKQSINNL